MSDGLQRSFACPVCHSALVQHPDQPRCRDCGHMYERREGVWRFLLPERRAALGQFIREYTAIRHAEGRGSQDASYYRALPERDLSGRMPHDWAIRSRSFHTLLRRVIEPLERARPGEALRILDLGAGNGWLSNRLACRGHMLAAVDLLDDSLDGLGAHRHYANRFTPIQGEFDRLPFLDSAGFDLAVFNASFHYTTDPFATLTEVRRVLVPNGRVIILDTPVYHNPSSGEQMVREREEEFISRYGFASNTLNSINYLTRDRLDGVCQAVGMEWRAVRPYYGLRWALRPAVSRVKGGREPASFWILLLSSKKGNR